MRVGVLVIAGVAVGGFFLFALYHLMYLRYSTGDAYPPYSSYGVTPLGARALFDSLDRLPEFDVSRNLRPIERIGNGRRKTLFFAGAAISEDAVSTLEALERFAATGGRIVIAFTPMTRRPRDRFDFGPGAQDEDTEGEVDEDVGEDVQEQLTPQTMDISKRWGFDYRFGDRWNASNQASLAADSAANLAARLPWRTILSFESLDPEWRTIYAVEEYPVVMERGWGQGSLVLLSDSYLLSNEALRSTRFPGFLLWLVGPNSHVVFDERHLGSAADPGIVALARQYGLEIVALALLVLLALYVWRSVVSLVPKYGPEDLPRSLHVEARDSAAALSSLLKRSIPKANLLESCVHEWSRSAPGGITDTELAAAIQQRVDADKRRPVRERNPVRTYHEICNLIEERKRRL